MSPRVVVVAPSDTEEGVFEVIVANLLTPGTVVASSRSREGANEMCVRLAWYYRARALPAAAA